MDSLTNDNVKLVNQNDAICPHCGRCRHCGQPSPIGIPAPIPVPIYPIPYQPMPTPYFGDPIISPTITCEAPSPLSGGGLVEAGAGFGLGSVGGALAGVKSFNLNESGFIIGIGISSEDSY